MLQGAARRLVELLQDTYRHNHLTCSEPRDPNSVEVSPDGSRVYYGPPLLRPDDILYTVLEFGNRSCTRCHRPYWDLVISNVRAADLDVLLARVSRSLM
jgi:hypothetical protein